MNWDLTKHIKSDPGYEIEFLNIKGGSAKDNSNEVTECLNTSNLNF